MLAWLFFIVIAALCFGLAWWATRPGRPRRAAAVFLGAAALIVGLGFYWMPPIGTLIALNDARRASAALPGRLDCSAAARAVEVTERMSNGLFKFTEEGDLQMPRFVWERISENERLTLAQVVGTGMRCRTEGHGSAEILDMETGEILYRVPEADQ